MQQQINLYRFLPQKEGFYFTRKILLVSYGGFVFILFFIYFIILIQKHLLANQISLLNAEVSQAHNQLTVLLQKYPVSDLDTLKEMIQQLQQEYANKEKVIDLESSYANFSNYLLGLANAIVPGVWLTQINFDRGETKITLQGFALEPPLLEKFYTQLSQQPIFSHLSFTLVKMQQTHFPASFSLTARKANRV